MKLNARIDKGTFGIACFWQAGLKAFKAPEWLRAHSLTFIIGSVHIELQWGG